MFDFTELDKNGDVTPPYNIEKHNFNAHNVIGDFKYDKQGKPMLTKNRNGELVDRLGHLVTTRGYRLDGNRNLVDNFSV